MTSNATADEAGCARSSAVGHLPIESKYVNAQFVDDEDGLVSVVEAQNSFLAFTKSGEVFLTPRKRCWFETRLQVPRE